MGARGMFRDREEIDCPHCGANYGSKKTAGVITTRALTEEEEADWRKAK